MTIQELLTKKMVDISTGLSRHGVKDGQTQQVVDLFNNKIGYC